jgi:hypothetical protein
MTLRNVLFSIVVLKAENLNENMTEYQQEKMQRQ